jgi:DNA polymerase (family X)
VTAPDASIPAEPGNAALPLERTLDQLAALAGIRADARERSLLRRAAALVRAHQIALDADLGPLLEHPPPDAPPEVLTRLQHMFDAGGWVLMESAIADLPADLRWLYESGAVTIEQIESIHQRLGAMTAADLFAAVDAGALRGLPGFDEAVERAVAGALPGLRAHIPRIPLGRATSIVEPLLDQLEATAGIEWASPVGSLRRGEEMVGDLEIVAAATDPAEAIDGLTRLPEVVRTLHRGARRVYLLTDRVQVGARFPAPAEAGAALLHLTGSRSHLAALGAIARTAGKRLAPEGLVAADGTVEASAREADIYAALGLPFIPAEIRTGGEAIDAAMVGTLPALVSRADIRGDLHMHSTWSDGRDSVEAMVSTCRTLGYQYAAITDHSPTSAAARNLSIDGVKRQADEIAQLRDRFPDITILHGCEVDILPDGRLDLPDRVLERLDIVLASLHDAAGHAGDRLLRRYTDAMRHPLVTMLTHPTNRLVPGRRGYDLDYDRLFDTAVETQTILEIDGAPSHLDLDGGLARRAVTAGVTVSIDSDCHRAELLERQMRLGIMTARRGWVEARHVINTRSIADIRALIARKRASQGR